jgi:hypothetical protein
MNTSFKKGMLAIALQGLEEEPTSGTCIHIGDAGEYPPILDRLPIENPLKPVRLDEAVLVSGYEGTMRTTLSQLKFRVRQRLGWAVAESKLCTAGAGTRAHRLFLILEVSGDFDGPYNAFDTLVHWGGNGMWRFVPMDHDVVGDIVVQTSLDGGKVLTLSEYHTLRGESSQNDNGSEWWAGKPVAEHPLVQWAACVTEEVNMDCVVPSGETIHIFSTGSYFPIDEDEDGEVYSFGEDDIYLPATHWCQGFRWKSQGD